MSELAAALPVLVPRVPYDLDRLRRLLLTGLSSLNSRRAYSRALSDFLAWYSLEARGPLSKLVVQEYRTQLEVDHLAASTINLRLSAIRKLVAEAAAAGLIAPDIAASIQKVRGARKLGIRAGNWLTREQASALLHAPDPHSLKGKRDRAILALLVGCGLRRSELAALSLEAIQQRDGRWVLPDLMGKGGRVRTVPVPAWVKRVIDDWTTTAGIEEGKLIRSINKSGKLWGDGITPKVIWWVVLEYAEKVDVRNLAPHDLRRTCAKLCRAAGGEPRADPITARTRLHSNHRTISWYPSQFSGSRQRPDGPRGVSDPRKYPASDPPKRFRVDNWDGSPRRRVDGPRRRAI